LLMREASAVRLGVAMSTDEPDLEEVEYLRTRVSMPEAWTRLVYIDDSLAGFAIGVGADLKTLMVLPSFWGQGLGSSLIAWAKETSRAAGQSTLSLWTQADNERAQRLYERHGFSRLADTKVHERTGESMVRYRLHLVPYAQALTSQEVPS
jgi:GNAT superfamily N-acetyltransferase